MPISENHISFHQTYCSFFKNNFCKQLQFAAGKITRGNNSHIWQFCKVTMWLPTFAVLRSQFYCGQNFQPRQFCWHGNKTAYLSSYTEAFRSCEKKTVKTTNLGSFTDTFWPSEIFANQQNFHIEQFYGHCKKPVFRAFSEWPWHRK